MGGQVGIAGHITIGDRVNIGAQSGIPTMSIRTATYWVRRYAIARDYARASVLIRKLPELNQTIRQLQKEIETLKRKLGE